MKKRLRKKKRLGEFREECFELEFAIVPPHTAAEDGAFWDAFIDMIEGLNLQCGGGGGLDACHYVVEVGQQGEIAAENRQAVLDWLSQQPRIFNVKARPLRDANYGWD
jgi:uncharacterized protein YggL (DUF469 family)